MALVSLMLFFGCAGKGLVSERYDEAFYRVPDLLPEEPIGEHQLFLVYSDNQAGWRAYETFGKKENWTNWRMALVPFYQIYMFGQGIIGTINYMAHRPDYGGRERRMMRDAIYDAARTNGAAFILNVGDINASDGRRPEHWALFLRENRIEHPLLEDIPYLPVIGNHERANDTLYGRHNFNAVFGRPGFYTVEFADASLFVLDSSSLVDQFGYIDDSVQERLFERWFVSGAGGGPSWLERQFELYDKPFKIVAIHHPPVTFAMHYRDWHRAAYGRNLTGKRKALVDLFGRYGVQVVFSGHDHCYQHSVVHHEGGGKTHFLVGGGAGTPLRDIVDEDTKRAYLEAYRSEGLDVEPVISAKMYHYFVVDIERGGMNITAVEVTGNDRVPLRTIETISFGESE